MDRNQHNSTRLDITVQPASVGEMVKEALEQAGYTVSGFEKDDRIEETVLDDGSVHLIRGEASIDRHDDSEYSRRGMTYEIGYTHDDGDRTFAKMLVTLFVTE